MLELLGWVSRSKLPDAGIRTVWELLQYYPRDYQNFEAGAWRADAHIMASGHVAARKVGF
jgi:RecG-like helicase